MKKIKQHIIGFQDPPILRSEKIRIRKFDWYCNAIKPLNVEKIPDQIEEELHQPNKRQLVINIFKDTSDKEEGEFGNKIGYDAFLKKPKKQYVHEFDNKNKRIKTTVISNQDVQSYTTYDYDVNGNLILLEYNRLGYVQHKNEYRYDTYGNLIELIHIKDVSHGNEQFEKESASKYTYELDQSKITQQTFKYVDNEEIQRGVNEYLYKNTEEITSVELKMIHLRTHSEVTYFKKYDNSNNLIETYSIQDEKHHPHSMKYKFEYNQQNIWTKRWRKTMNETLTLYSERRIENQ